MSTQQFNNLLKDAIALKKETETPISNIDMTNTSIETSSDVKDNSKYIYPSLILVPLFIVLISIFTLTISVFSKIILILFILCSIVVYIMQSKNVNISKHLDKISASIKSDKKK